MGFNVTIDEGWSIFELFQSLNERYLNVPEVYLQ